MTGAHRQQPARPATCYPRHMAHAAIAISWAAVLLIAFLNPVLCLLHCALTHQHPALTSEQRSFLCDLGWSTDALVSAPFSAVWNGPRAVYPAVRVVAPILSIVILVVATLRPHTARVCTYIAPPRFPPPRVRLAHVAR